MRLFPPLSPSTVDWTARDQRRDGGRRAGAGEVEHAEGGPFREIQEGYVFSGCIDEGGTEIDAEGAHVLRAQEKGRRGGSLPAAEVDGRKSGARRKPGRIAAGVFQPEVRGGAEFPGSEAGQEKSVQPEAHGAFGLDEILWEADRHGQRPT